MPAIANSPSAIERLGLNDPARFRIMRRLAIFRVHPMIAKTVGPVGRDSALPDGPRTRTIEIQADRHDLEMMAKNANRAVAAGRPPAIQIGHTALDDRPEPYHPKVIGLTSNYQLGELEGEPCLFADFHVRTEFYPDAVSYPRISIERYAFNVPDEQTVSAIALLRRSAQQALPIVPYGAEVGMLSGQLACYGLDLEAPARDDDGAIRRSRLDWMTRNCIYSQAEGRRKFEAFRRSGKA